ncbi:hypothetical protein BDW02DRAFT_531962 [Decorospora gaudefroyi]|uniref:Uncharacterized protein n=1 Tax=Decorospora gaudefroyi TaxID=184978 RepID=A0A6A5K309_9PLEO|nr:hypothetical protein BDW02DRAFT_531962 [Decorospora gaudefroyi]
MATTNPAPAGQARSSAPAGSGNHHIDQLQGMLNMIFLHTGRFIKETQAGGGTGRMKQQLQQTVPNASERFHDALDELENEVRLAQTVLRRDMALLKQDRKKREAVAKEQEVEKARLAAESRHVHAKAEEPPKKTDKTPTPKPAEVPPKAPEVPTKAEEPAVKDVTMGEGEEAKAPSPPPPVDTSTEPAKDPLFDGTPTTANQQDSEFDFDAMFGDAMDTAGDDNHHNDMMDTSGDMDFTVDDGNDGPSLLRGLEDFAKDGDDDHSNNANHTSNLDMDFAMQDLPHLNMNPDPNPKPTNTHSDVKPAPEAEPPSAPTQKAEESKPAPPPPTEEKKEATTTTDEDMTGTLATDDLEDLFNMDEYENPEQSSFDDAFFNFE